MNQGIPSPPGSRGKKSCKPCAARGDLNGPNIAKSGGVDQGIFSDLSTFTFRKVGRRWIEFQALPGPGARALRAKTMRHDSFSGPGGQAVLSPRTGLSRCRGARRGARCARLPLRKHGGRSPDEFFSRRCFFRATPLLPGHKLAFPQGREPQKWAKS